jgi:hypothetical protein
MALAASLLLLVLAGPLGAQFDLLSWTFSPGANGHGTLTPSQMMIIGPNSGGCSGGGSTASYVATAPYNGTLSVRVEYDSDDKFTEYDPPQFLLDGTATQLSSIFFGEGQFLQTIPGGSTFGFAIHSTDCIFGAGKLTLTDFVFVPLPYGPTIAGAAGEAFGASLARVGDVDLDGVNDLVVGAPEAARAASRCSPAPTAR